MKTTKSDKPRATRAARYQTVRCADGKLLSVKLTRGLAIKLHCTECCGFETNPADCTSVHCALYAYRGKSRKTMRGDIEPEPRR